jgi:hypothetical protein
MRWVISQAGNIIFHMLEQDIKWSFISLDALIGRIMAKLSNTKSLDILQLAPIIQHRTEL